jgi:hypothetical protein
MTASVHLQILQAMQTAVDALPIIEACYLDRPETVGDNEPKPLVIINSGDVEGSNEVSHTSQDDTVTIEVNIYVALPITQTGFTTGISQAVDDPMIAVHSAIYTAVRTVPGFYNITQTARRPIADSGNGMLQMIYNVDYSARQDDFSVPSPP